MLAALGEGSEYTASVSLPVNNTERREKPVHSIDKDFFPCLADLLALAFEIAFCPLGIMNCIAYKIEALEVQLPFLFRKS